MFLDGALLTTVVPIIPEKIKDIKITNWVSKILLSSHIQMVGKIYGLFLRICYMVKTKINFRFGHFRLEKM